MIFVASLSLLTKKAFGAKCHQGTIANIAEMMPMDPETSGMDAAIFGPQDFRGAAGKKLGDAISAKHAGVCVIYLCTNDKEKANCTSSAAHIKMVRKITPDAIKDAVSEFYGSDISVMEAKYGSMSGNKDKVGPNPQAEIVETRSRQPKTQRQRVVIPLAPVEPEPEPTPEPEAVPEPAEEEVPTPVITEPEELPPPEKPTMEEMLTNFKSLSDWRLIRRELERDNLKARLIMENSEYAGMVSMMDILEVKIQEVWTNPHLDPTEKYKRITSFGQDRAALQGNHNNILVTRFLDLFNKVCAIATTCVEQRMTTISTAISKIQTDKDALLEEIIAGEKDPTQKLYDYVQEMANTTSELCQLLEFLRGESMNGYADRLNEHLPSDNDYINSMLNKTQNMFMPENTPSLFNRILEAVQTGDVALSAVESKIEALMRSVFNTLTQLQKVSDYHVLAAQSLMANHVENVVIRDTILKDCFRVICGTPNTGLTATAITYAEMRARTHNILVVDLTGHGQYARYGYSTHNLDTFLVERIQEKLCVVEGPREYDAEKIALMLNELKTRLTYYAELYVILDSRDADKIDQIGREALTVDIITNCTTESLEFTKQAYQTVKQLPNTAKRLVAIDCPIDLYQLAVKLGIDVGSTRFIPIPYLRAMRNGGLTGTHPISIEDTLVVFQEAYKA